MTAPNPFIPHGQTCQADDGRGDDFGKCHQAAVRSVPTGHGDRYVCRDHLTLWQPDATVVRRYRCPSCAAAPNMECMDPMTHFTVKGYHGGRRELARRSVLGPDQ